MVLLLQGQSDPLMPGQRKANLKCQSPMDISEVRARCVYEAIGWFRIGFCNVTCSEEEALGGSRAIVLLELVLTSRTSTVSACSSFAVTLCNTRFIKGHKPSNNIRARIKSHVYTTEWTVYQSTYHVKRYNKANMNVIYYINDKNMSITVEVIKQIRNSEAGCHRVVNWETTT